MSDHGQIPFSYQVHLFRNMDPEPLLADPVTAVFAPLARASPGQRLALLRQAVRIITGSDEPHDERRNLLECAAVLASLRIDDTTIIDATIKEAAMPIDLTQSSYFREAQARGRSEGEALGRAEGRLLGMLELRFGPAANQVGEQVLERLSLQADPARLIVEAASLDDLARRLGV